MAVRLPDATSLGRRPVPQGNRGFATQNTEAPGRAYEGLGQVIGKVGEDLQQADDEQKVLEYRRKLIEWDKVNVRDPETGAAAKSGKDAFDLPKTLGESFDKFSAEAASGLTTNRQRKLAQDMALGRRDAITSWASGHALREREKFDLGEYQANIAASKDNATLYPSLAAAELEAMAAATRGYLSKKGLGADAIAGQIKSDASEVHTRIVSGMVKDGNAAAAENYFKANFGGMTAQARDAAQTVLKEVGTRRKVQAFEDDVAARGLSTEEALKEARTKFIEDPVARDDAVTRVKTMAAERATLDAQAAKQVSTDAWSALMASGTMSAIPPATMALLRKKAPEEERQMRDWLEAKWRRAKADAEGKKHEESADETRQYLSAIEMAIDRPADFAGMSVEAFARYEPLLTKEHFNKLTAMRVGINKDEAKVVQIGKLAKGAIAEVRQVVAAQKIELTGKDRSAEKVNEAQDLEAAIYGAIDAAAASGPVDAKKAREIALGQLKLTYEQGSGSFFGLGTPKQVPAFKREAGKEYIGTRYEAIPADIRKELEASARKTNGGMAATSAEIERMYQRAVDAGRIK